MSTLHTLNGFDLDTLNGTISAIREKPELGAVTFRSASQWSDDRRVNTSIESFAAGGTEQRRPAAHNVRTDLPHALMGTDEGPSPLEVALSALSACVTTTLVAHAALKGFEIRSLSVKASGDVDLRGILSIAEVRSGYRALRLHIDLDSDVPADQVASFIDDAVHLSPMFDLFRHGTEIALE